MRVLCAVPGCCSVTSAISRPESICWNCAPVFFKLFQIDLLLKDHESSDEREACLDARGLIRKWLSCYVNSNLLQRAFRPRRLALLRSSEVRKVLALVIVGVFAPVDHVEIAGKLCTSGFDAHGIRDLRRTHPRFSQTIHADSLIEDPLHIILSTCGSEM
jgi:hypothetical protein